MSTPNYSAYTDQQLLVEFTESLMNTFTDTSGDDDTRWRAVANAAIDGVLRAPLGIEVLRRKRKWGEPTPPPPPGTLPPAVPITNPDKLAIV